MSPVPGVDAKNEILILRGRNMDARARDAFIKDFYANPPADPCLCFPPLPDDPSWIRIPMRLPRGQIPAFKPEDIILENGDIVLIEGREEEVYYMSGMGMGIGGQGGGGGGVGNNQGGMGGGIPLPRDRDLDVLQAIGMSGGPLSAGGALGGGIQSFGGVAPSQLFILRQTPCNGQIIISVDLTRAVKDPAARPLVQAGDILMIRFKPKEEILNFALGGFLLQGLYGRR